MDYLQHIEFDGLKLREARGDRQLTEVARIIGISKQRLWNYENGLYDPSSDIVVRLCMLYQKPIEFFAKANSAKKNLASAYIGY